MAEIQLKQNWAGYVPNTIVSVSDERAKYLVKGLKIAKYVAQKTKKTGKKGK